MESGFASWHTCNDRRWHVPKSFPSKGPAPGQTAESVLISVPGAEVLEMQEPPAVLGPPPPLVWCPPDFLSGIGHLIHDWPPASLTHGLASVLSPIPSWHRLSVLFKEKKTE